MANPSQAEIFAQWGRAIKVLDEIRRFGRAGGYPAGNTINLVGMLDDLQQNYEGDFIDEAEDAVQGIRDAVASQISPGVIAAVHRPFMKQYCKSVIGRSDLSGDDEMWQEIFRYMQANAIYLQSRAFTFGTATAAGANVGNGQILRLTRDKYNFPIESGYVDSKRAICTADENTGTRRGREVFEIKGQAKTRDELERSGSGLSGTLTGQTPDESILNNAGFRAFGGTAGGTAPTSLTSWTSTNLAGASLAYNSTNYGIDQTNFFRRIPSDGTPGSLVVKTSARLTQRLRDSKQLTMSPDTPWLMAVVWNRAVNSATGTLNIRMGSVTTTVTVAAQTGWNVTTVPSNIPLGFSCWYRQFAQADLQFQVEWIQTGGTGLLLAEILVLPGTQFDGTWHWAIPASVATYAPWRVLDQFDIVDIATGSAKNQTFIARGFPGVYLPSSNGSSITFSEIS